MSVKAKFVVRRVEREMQTHSRTVDGKTEWVPVEVQTVVMAPVYGNGDPEHENTKFWQASPSGELRLGCVNHAAASYFELGKEYYLDFTKA